MKIIFQSNFSFPNTFHAHPGPQTNSFVVKFTCGTLPPLSSLRNLPSTFKAPRMPASREGVYFTLFNSVFPKVIPREPFCSPHGEEVLRTSRSQTGLRPRHHNHNQQHCLHPGVRPAVRSSLQTALMTNNLSPRFQLNV